MLVLANDHGVLLRFETESDDHLAALQARLGYRAVFESAQRALKAWVIQTQAPEGEWYWSLQADGYFRQLQAGQYVQHAILHQIFVMLWSVAVLPVRRRYEHDFNFSKPLSPRDAWFFQVPTSAHEKLQIMASYENDLAVLQAALHTDRAIEALARFASLEGLP